MLTNGWKIQVPWVPYVQTYPNGSSHMTGEKIATGDSCLQSWWRNSWPLPFLSHAVRGEMSARHWATRLKFHACLISIHESKSKDLHLHLAIQFLFHSRFHSIQNFEQDSLTGPLGLNTNTNQNHSNWQTDLISSAVKALEHARYAFRFTTVETTTTSSSTFLLDDVLAKPEG